MISSETWKGFGTAFFNGVQQRIKREKLKGFNQWKQLTPMENEILGTDWIFFGLISHLAVNDLTRETGMTKNQAILAIVNGLERAREFFLEHVWKPRCTATIAWEKHNGIDRKAKRTKPPTDHPEIGIEERRLLDPGFEIRPTHRPVDKKKERWRSATLAAVQAAYSNWTFRVLGGSDSETHMNY